MPDIYIYDLDDGYRLNVHLDVDRPDESADGPERDAAIDKLLDAIDHHRLIAALNRRELTSATFHGDNGAPAGRDVQLQRLRNNFVDALANCRVICALLSDDALAAAVKLTSAANRR